MSVSARLSDQEKQALLAENTQWRTVVEQVVLAIAKDPQAMQLMRWLMVWLSDPKNVKRSLQLTIGQIIEIGRRVVGEPA